MTTPNINLPVWAAAQDQPWVPENEAKNLIDALLPAVVVSDAIATPPASPAAGACYIVAAAATGAWMGWEKSIAAYIGGAWVQVTPQEGWVFWVVSNSGRSAYVSGAWVKLIEEAPSDGTDYVRRDGAWVSIPAITYNFGISYAGTPTSGEIMGRISITTSFTCPADFAGSVGHVGANPSAFFPIDVRVNGASIGTITIADDGVFTFATVGNVDQSISAGSLITFVATASVDATITDISSTIFGSL